MAAPHHQSSPLPLRELALVAFLAVSATAQGLVPRDVAAMGTWLHVEITAATRDTALLASEAAVRAVHGVEQRLSTWRADSELVLANAAPVGVLHPLSAETAADLAFAFDVRARTDGAFEPAFGAVLDAYGLRLAPRWPAAAALAAAREAAQAGVIELRGRSLLRRRAEAWVASDAFAKGIALDRAAAAAMATGALELHLDFGGQWLARGAVRRLALVHPWERAREVATLDLAAGRSAATSGNGERCRLVDGRELGHLFDPRSGRPAADFGSVTVIAASAALADATSTALFVLGVDAGLAMATRLGVEAVFAVCPPPRDRDARAAGETAVLLRATSGLRACLRPAAGVDLTFALP